MPHRARRSAVLLLLAAALAAPPVLARRGRAEETTWYGVEVGGQLAGWTRITVRPGDPEIVETESLVRLTALGQPFDVRTRSRLERDPVTRAPRRLEFSLRRGDDVQEARIAFAGGEARLLGEDGGARKTLSMEGVLLEDEHDLSAVLRHLPADGATWRGRVLFPPRFEVHDKRWTREGTEEIEVGGKRRKAVRVAARDETMGLGTTTWADPDSGLVLRVAASNGITVSLADASVRDRIAAADYDRMIFAGVGVDIPNPRELTFMKLKARLRTVGVAVTPGSLNVPGQRFTGTVHENLVEGVFEISWPRYDGRDAPPFPWEEARRLVPARYLAPEEMIESDDPAIVARARELTAGARDAWEAARRLSRFVAEEIAYQVPGGSAKHTLETRRGECGAHAALLVALCRAAGIPARVVSGAVYSHLHGGSFGQHAWVEIFMGKGPGWVPVDPTMHEVDRCDAGHLRLGERATFNPVEVKVLDWVAGDRRRGAAPPVLAPARPTVPWETGRKVVFRYRVRGREAGTETLVIERVDPDGTVHGRTELSLGPLQSSSTWVLGPGGEPREYRGSGTAGTLRFEVACTFSRPGPGKPGKVHETAKRSDRDRPQELDVELPAGTRLLPNNNFGVFSLLLASAPAEEGAARTVPLFSPNAARVLSGDLRTGPREEIEWNGRRVTARRVTVAVAGLEIVSWLDGKGRLLRSSQQQGAVEAELVPGDGGEGSATGDRHRPEPAGETGGDPGR